MSKIRVKTEEGEIEVGIDSLQLPEGYGIITPDRVPDGYFNKDAVNKMVKENVNKTKERMRSELEQDEEFQRSILSRHNISLDDEGKPKGLKPDFDPEKWKQEQAKKLTEPYEKKLEETNKRLQSFRGGLVKSELLKSANGLFREEFTKSFTGSDEPFVIKQFADAFDVDDDGNVAMKDKDGTFAVDGDGSRITPQKYFEINKDKFSDLLQDKRQRGTGTNPGGHNGRYTEEDIASMSEEEYAKNRDQILKGMGD
jgi:hypothetical protein